MLLTTITQQVLLPAPPEAVYKALTDDATFASMSGAPALNLNSLLDDWSAFGGLLGGRNTVLETDRRIEQTWYAVTDHWPEGHRSQVEIHLEETPDGQTQLTLNHINLPDFEAAGVDNGWHKYYWDRLRLHFVSSAAPTQ